MCFSAQASFGLSAILLPAGVYCIHRAIATKRMRLFLAVIPLIFSVQQFCEGLVWTGLDHGNPELARNAAMVFLYFALAFWPFWIPFCAFVLEPPSTKKWILGGITLAGLFIGAMLYVPVLMDPTLLEPQPLNHSIHYDIGGSAAFRLMAFEWWQLMYVIVVASPPIVAPSRGFFIFGIAIVVTAAVSHVFCWYASASVWCFFAAILSIYLCFSFYRLPTAVAVGDLA
jgi:hypothetical protein